MPANPAYRAMCSGDSPLEARFDSYRWVVDWAPNSGYRSKTAMENAGCCGWFVAASSHQRVPFSLFAIQIRLQACMHRAVVGDGDVVGVAELGDEAGEAADFHAFAVCQIEVG